MNKSNVEESMGHSIIIQLFATLLLLICTSCGVIGEEDNTSSGTPEQVNVKGHWISQSSTPTEIFSFGESVLSYYFYDSETSTIDSNYFTFEYHEDGKHITIEYSDGRVPLDIPFSLIEGVLRLTFESIEYQYKQYSGTIPHSTWIEKAPFSPMARWMHTGEGINEILDFTANTMTIHSYNSTDSTITKNAYTIKIDSLAKKLLFPPETGVDTTTWKYSKSNDTLELLFDETSSGSYVQYFGTIPPTNWVLSTAQTFIGTWIDTGTAPLEIFKLDGTSLKYYSYNNVNFSIDSATLSYELDLINKDLNVEGLESWPYTYSQDTLYLQLDIGTIVPYVRYDGVIPHSTWNSSTLSRSLRFRTLFNRFLVE